MISFKIVSLALAAFLLVAAAAAPMPRDATVAIHPLVHLHSGTAVVDFSVAADSTILYARGNKSNKNTIRALSNAVAICAEAKALWEQVETLAKDPKTSKSPKAQDPKTLAEAKEQIIRNELCIYEHGGSQHMHEEHEGKDKPVAKASYEDAVKASREAARSRQSAKTLIKELGGKVVRASQKPKRRPLHRHLPAQYRVLAQHQPGSSA